MVSEETIGEVSEIPEAPKRPRKTLIAILLIVIVGVASVSVFAWWYTQKAPEGEEVPTGYKTFSKYGISFDYPEGSDIQEVGVLESTPDVDSGVVHFEWRDGTIQYAFTVSWIKTVHYDIEAGFEGSFSSLEEEEGVSNLVQGARGESTLLEHTLPYQYFEFDLDTKHFYGVITLTYFDELEKGFIFGYTDEYENPLPRLQEILETFEARSD